MQNNGMKRNGKRIAGLMRVLMLTLTLMLGTALPASMAKGETVTDDSGQCGANVTYSFLAATGVLTISGTGEMSDCSFSCPWAGYRGSIRSVVIGEGVTNVGRNAFDGCSNLSGAVLPETLEVIGESAFKECVALKCIRFPDSLQKIDRNAFEGAGVQSVIIPDSVTELGDHAFKCNLGMTALVISDNLDVIPQDAFQACPNLRVVRLGKNVTTIGDEAFASSTGRIVSFAFWNKVSTIGQDAFESVIAPQNIYYHGTEDDWNQIKPAFFDTSGMKMEDGWNVHIVSDGDTDISLDNDCYFQVTWKDWDGTVLGSKELSFLESPVYSGETPAREAGQQYSYVFAGWSDGTTTYPGKLPPRGEDVTYTAVFRNILNQYSVVFQDEDGRELKKTMYDYGTLAADVEAPDGPSKTSTPQYDYTFAGWSPAVADVERDAVYTATYTQTARKYTVTFLNGYGGTIKTETVAYEDAAPEPSEPTREGYVFTSWDKAFNKITADTTVTAQWAKLYTVTFVDGQGKTLKTETVESGKAATAPSTPTRDGYTFTGWDKAFNKITEDTTVTAQWEKAADPETKPASEPETDPAEAPVSIKDAKVLLSAESFKYTGKIRKPVIKTVAGKALKEGTDYTAKWSNEKSKDAGTYTITITGKGGYTGTTKAAYKITKAANPLKIKGNTARIKYSKLKKKNQTLAVKKVIKVTKKGKGKLTYKKVSGSKKITINKKTGKVTVKKGLKKGKYKVKVKVKAAGNKNYKASKAKKVTFTIVVK